MARIARGDTRTIEVYARNQTVEQKDEGGRMSRKMSRLVLDEFVVGTAFTYTAPQFNDDLGQADRLAIQAIVDQVTGTSPTFTAQIEHSSDQRNWSAKNGTAEINGTGLSPTATNVLSGFETSANPSHGFIRVRVALGGTSPQAHVKLYVTGRDAT